MPKRLDPNKLSGAFARRPTRTSLDHLVPEREDEETAPLEAAGDLPATAERSPRRRKAPARSGAQAAPRKSRTRRAKKGAPAAAKPAAPEPAAPEPAPVPAPVLRLDRAFGWREPWAPGAPALPERGRIERWVGAALRVLRAA